MFNVLKMCLILLCLNSSATVLSELLPYHSYYFIKPVSEDAYQFEIWLHRGKEVTRAFVAIKDLKGIADLKLTSFRETIARLDPPPEEVMDFTKRISNPEIKQVVNALYDKIKTLIPGTTLYDVIYRGRFKEIRIHEVIAYSPEGSEKRVGIRSTQDFKVTARGIEASSNLSLAEPLGFDQDLLNQTSLIDFVLPSEVEGSSLFAPHHDGETSSHHNAYENLLNAIFEAVFTPSQTESSLQKQFEKIKSDQGSSAKQLKQFFSFSFHVVGYARSSTDVIGATVNSAIAAQDIIQNSIYLVRRIPQMGIEVTISGGKDDFRVRVSQDESTQMAEYKLKLSNPITDSIIYGPIYLVSKDHTQAQHEFDFAGPHPFRLIHVEINQDMPVLIKTGLVLKDSCSSALK